MPISAEATPNPNAMKFSVGQPVGGPVTIKAGEDAEQAFVRAIFDAGSIRQVFMTADFVSVIKDDAASWDDLIPPVQEALEAKFG